MNDENQKEKKNLRCVVCSGRAHGYNFDQISCESCKGKKGKRQKLLIIFSLYFKAFFRRNALRNMVKTSLEF